MSLHTLYLVPTCVMMAGNGIICCLAVRGPAKESRDLSAVYPRFSRISWSNPEPTHPPRSQQYRGLSSKNRGVVNDSLLWRCYDRMLHKGRTQNADRRWVSYRVQVKPKSCVEPDLEWRGCGDLGRWWWWNVYTVCQELQKLIYFILKGHPREIEGIIISQKKQ